MNTITMPIISYFILAIILQHICHKESPEQIQCKMAVLHFALHPAQFVYQNIQTLPPFPSILKKV